MVARQTQPHVLIVGGGYGGLAALRDLILFSNGETAKPRGRPPPGRGPPPAANGNGAPLRPPAPVGPPPVRRALKVKPRYTVLDERDGFYHTIGAPLGQISSSYAREFWVPFADVAYYKRCGESIQFLQGTASTVDLATKSLTYYSTSNSADQSKINYDYLVVASGIRRSFPVVPEALNLQAYLAETDSFVASIAAAKRVVVVGGGAVGAEMAAEVKNNYPECEVVLVHSRDRLLSAEKFPDDFKDKVLESLTEHGVKVMLGRRVVGEEKTDGKTDGFAKRIKLSPGEDESLLCDEVVYSSSGGNKASTGFLPGKLVDEQGCVLVRPTLQFAGGDGSPNADAHFAIGDAASWSGVKRVGGAQSMAGIVATNIVNIMLDAEDSAESEDADASELATCPEFEPRMSLALGATVVVFRPPNHVKWGKELKGRVFGRGLAIDSNLSRLHLTERNSTAAHV